MDLSQL